MYHEVCFNRGTEAGSGGGGGGGRKLMWAIRSAPPVIFCLLRAWIQQLQLSFEEKRVTFHLVKNSENSGSGLNGKRFFGSPDWKIPRKSGTAQKVVPFSRLERPNRNLCFSSLSPVPCLSRSFKRAPCFQKMAAYPGQVSGSFLQTNFRATTSALPAMF